MRNISCAMTTRQILDRTKDVTRRLGWKNAKPGDVVCVIEKGQGLKKGEKIRRLRVIEFVDVSFIPAGECSDEDAVREGYPHLSGAEFAEMFCRTMRVDPSRTITRLEFKYRNDIEVPR